MRPMRMDERRYKASVTKAVQIVAMSMRKAKGEKMLPRPRRDEALRIIAEWIATGEPFPPVVEYRRALMKLLKRIRGYERDTLHAIREEWDRIRL